MARVTLMDVARHCGVSRATVSLVLNDSPLVAAKTRDRVRQAMTELGYVYNRAAASLRASTGRVADNITNPYFAEFAAGLQDTLASSGTVPLLAISNEDRDLQNRLSSPWSNAMWMGLCWYRPTAPRPPTCRISRHSPGAAGPPPDRDGCRLRRCTKQRRWVRGRGASVQPRLPANRLRRWLRRLLSAGGARGRRSGVPERTRSDP